VIERCKFKQVKEIQPPKAEKIMVHFCALTSDKMQCPSELKCDVYLAYYSEGL